MPVKQGGQVIAVEHGPTGLNREEPEVQRKAAAFARWHEPDDARVHVRICEGARGEIPWAYSARAAVSPSAARAYAGAGAYACLP